MNNPTAREAYQGDSVDWLAFQYAAGELTGVERDAFQRRLADDLSAQEALAEVVELTTAMRVVLASPSPRTKQSDRLTPPSRSRSRLAWLGAGIALSLLVLLTVSLYPRDDSQDSLDDSPAVVENQRHDELALTWLQTHTELAAQNETAWDSVDFVTGEDESVIVTVESELIELPDWLFVAVDAVEISSAANPQSISPNGEGG